MKVLNKTRMLLQNYFGKQFERDLEDWNKTTKR